MPCPAGGCHFGEQKAGWPLPAFVDDPGGGSPTSGWGLLGPEDLPRFMPIILNVLFYSALLWLALGIVQFVRRQAIPLRLVIRTLPLNILLAVSLWIFYFFFAYFAPIGRGHIVQVYADTPAGRSAVPAFLPTVSIPLGELVQNYGAPDEVWLDTEMVAETSVVRMMLQWDSIGMFVSLPQMANKTYSVEETTHVKMIIFPYEVPLLAVDGKPLGEQKIPWTGYGTYQP